MVITIPRINIIRSTEARPRAVLRKGIKITAIVERIRTTEIKAAVPCPLKEEKRLLSVRFIQAERISPNTKMKRKLLVELGVRAAALSVP